MWPDLGSQVSVDITAYGTCPRGTISGCQRIQPAGQCENPIAAG